MMERIRRIAMAISMLCIICVCVDADPQLPVVAQDRAIVGEILLLEMEIPAQGHSTVKGILSFDDQQVQFHSLPEAEGWDIDFLGKTFTMTRKENGSTTIHLKMKLQVLPVPDQTKICVSFQFTGEDSAALGDASHEITVGEPLSHENFLTELAVEGGTVSPQFHPDVLEYAVAVPANCQQPHIYAVGAEKSVVEIISEPFVEGGVSAVTIVVTAENGIQRKYTLQVIRDPQEETVPETTVEAQPETMPLTQPTQSTQPTQDLETTTQPTQSTKPVKPIKPVQPTEEMQSTEPGNPTEATRVTKPTVPIQTTKPTRKPSGGEEPMDLRDEGVPGWVVAAGILAGAALGGAGVILLVQKRGKDR